MPKPCIDVPRDIVDTSRLWQRSSVRALAYVAWEEQAADEGVLCEKYLSLSFWTKGLFVPEGGEALRRAHQKPRSPAPLLLHFRYHQPPIPRRVYPVPPAPYPPTTTPLHHLFIITMAAQPQNVAVNVLQNNPQPAAQRGNEENVPPGPLPSMNNRNNAVTRVTLGPFNGPLAPVSNPAPSMPFDGPVFADWPFRGPEGPLRRTRIEGNDELVFGSF
ncbi:hypothetical protein ONZ51_g7573 [Trametes cubensis]|uniref:Uncharacterized protein n=1 Tax=Trametes cubensis TaxID=1111947 RepID=A0AAD7TR23_9APHY|nr:hypothetical protein ONZ51_g7573 [Trametes cubensis]